MAYSTKGEQERVDSEKINAKAPSQNGLSTEGEDICTVLMDTSLQPEETDASNADVVKSKDSGKRVGFDSPASGPILTSLNEKRVTMVSIFFYNSIYYSCMFLDEYFG